jgi:hypothetical protein
MTGFGRSLSCPFLDPAWPVRVLVGATLEAVPMLVVLPLAVKVMRGDLPPTPRQLGLLVLPALLALACRWVVIGYMRRLAKAVLDGGPECLPAWDRFDEDFVEGLKLWLLGLALFLPALGATVFLAFLIGVLGAPGMAWVPFVLVLPPLALVTLAYLPAGLLAAIGTGNLAAAFDVGRVSREIGQRLGPYLLAFVVAIVAQILAQLGFLLLCVGVFATRFIATCIAVHAFASVFGPEPPEEATALPPTAAPAQA